MLLPTPCIASFHVRVYRIYVHCGAPRIETRTSRAGRFQIFHFCDTNRYLTETLWSPLSSTSKPTYSISTHTDLVRFFCVLIKSCLKCSRKNYVFHVFFKTKSNQGKWNNHIVIRIQAMLGCLFLNCCEHFVNRSNCMSLTFECIWQSQILLLSHYRSH